MTGSEYERKRRFETTPEPPPPAVSGDVDPATAPPGELFVIQQHHATRLHHDFRLEMLNGSTPVLVSWAIPKGLPRTKGQRALAIRTEDHPIEYATFSGSIAEGNYGAGEVRIFDEGTYEIVDRDDTKLTVRLEGNRQRGVYHLVRTKSRGSKGEWLAILSVDERPPPDEPPPPEPMLATLAAQPFDDPEWAFEPKWDGIRAIASCDTATRLITRNGRDVTNGYPELQRIHDQLVALDAMLDGEIVAFADGIPSFQRLQQRMHVRDERQLAGLSKRIPVAYIAFDLLYLDGRDLTSRPYHERRSLLEETLVTSDVLQLSPRIEASGVALFEASANQGLEGVVAKKLTSRYEPGARSRSWLKVKVTFDADVVVVGWTEGEGNRAGTLGSLVAAVYDGGALRYVGNVGTGFDRASLAETHAALAGLGAAPPPFDESVLRARPDLRRAHWVPPVLVAKVEYRQVTAAGMLRAPSFQGLRDDKRPDECTFDQLSPAG
jgi:bifunctional non-homologous end joining protein LigD